MVGYPANPRIERTIGVADPKVLRPAGWIKVLSLGAALLFVAGFVATYVSRGLNPIALGFAALSVLAILGVLEALTLRVVLDVDALRVSKLWSTKAYPRSDIRSVTWAKGCPVSLGLADGRWVRLPEVGTSSQGVVNTIRAWLKRTS
ncbi:MAG TPA: hypothetical protein VLK65_20120, partial [Vicinamibacteria bacterium]|nr:hypothetical protein [Vicinamibacteria bacterium]